jgi:predicted nucleic acid-binding protein
LTVFADGSAVVKLYVPERYHEVIRSRTDLLVVASVTRVEVASAFWRKQRLGELDGADVVTLMAAFEADLAEPKGRFGIVSLEPAVLIRAVEVVARHGLRAYDAIQLATASVTRDIIAELGSFAAFDHDLRRAAEAESFALVPAELN